MTGRHRIRTADARVPVLLVCGVQESAMLSAGISLQFGLPNPVAVRHVIDPAASTLTRTVSDMAGTIEHEVIDLEHACVSCAIREDIVPTLERLASSGQWSSIVACLPVAAESVQVCRVLGWAPANAPHVRIASVVTALDGSSVAEDLLGDALLLDRGLHTAQDDDRGVAEVGCAMVEYADAISLTTPCDGDEDALLAALARPGVPIVTDPWSLDASALVATSRDHEASEDWAAEVRRGPLPPLHLPGAWRLDLRSERPVHPDRFAGELEILGGGPRRSRGCFWLPTRPTDICAWDAAGGQASVGSTQTWQPGQQPLTRIVVVGIDDDPDEISQAFHRCLLTDEEIATRGHVWNQPTDGLEPWLGAIHRVA